MRALHRLAAAAVHRPRDVTCLIFAVGLLQVRWHSFSWPREQGRAIPLAYAASYAWTAFALGSAVGVALGLLLLGISRLVGHSAWQPLRVGYFVGLDIIAIAILWVLPAVH